VGIIITFAKRLTAAVICLSLIFIPLSGCENENVGNLSGKVTDVFRTDFITPPDGYIARSDGMTVSDGRVYILCVKSGKLNNEITADDYILCSYDINTGGDMQTEALGTVNDGAWIREFLMLSDGGMITVEYHNGGKDMSLVRTSDKGGVIFNIDGERLFDVELENQPVDYSGSSGFSIRSIAEGDGCFYIASGDKIIAVNTEGSPLFTIPVRAGTAEKLAVTRDGEVLLQYSVNNANRVCRLDLAAHSMGKKLEIPAGYADNIADVYIGPGYDLYFKNNEGLYGMNSDGSEPVMIINWINSDVVPSVVQTLCVVSPQKFVYSGYDILSSGQEIAILSMVPEDEIKEKTIIKAAFIEADFLFSSAVVNFNRRNVTYRIVTTDYSRYNTEEDPSRAVTLLNADIAAGNIPDILVLSSVPVMGAASIMPVESYIEKGLFCDLYEFMDNDPDMGRGDLLECVRVPFETDGHLYRLPMSYTIHTYFGKKSNFPGESWTPAEALEYAKSLGEDKRLLQIMNPYWILRFFLNKGISCFVDYESGTADFNSSLFIEMLGYLKSLGGVNFDSENDKNLYREDKILLMDRRIDSLSEYLSYKYGFGNENINAIGYPRMSGGGAEIEAHISYAITARSQNKAGAWEFIKYRLSDECQTAAGIIQPVTVGAFNKNVEHDMNLYYYFRKEGGSMHKESPLPDEEKKNYDTEIIPAEQDKKAFLDIINSADTVSGYDTRIWEIIDEEFSAYLGSDSRTAAETADIIQRRVSIYLSEIK
jgi:ABC-type glycerol-3-phosphate transport system substrate-binding protein